MKRHPARHVLAGAFALVALTLPGAAGATAGELDPSFGGTGLVTTEFGLGAEAHSVAVQADGGIVVAGGATLCCVGGDFALVRYNSDGSLDADFGAGGKVTTDFGFFDTAWGVAVQPDGRIVAVGGGVGGENDFRVARYDSDGSLDASFGTGGKTTTDFGPFSFDVALAVALQGDGKIVAAGLGQSSFALARYNPDGTLDETFGTGGKVLTRLVFTGFGDQANAVAIQADGKIVAVGETNAGDFGVVRYNADGSLDSTFGTGGIVLTRFRGFFNRGRAVAIQADGKIVASGNDGLGCFALARYDADGTLDAAFGTGGKLVTDFGCGFGLRGAAALAIQANGKIVAAGEAGGGVRDFALARFLANGTLDPAFGTGGTVTTDFGGGFAHPHDGAFGVALAANGGIVAAGSGMSDCCGGGARFALARYTGDPADVTPPVITTPGNLSVDAIGPGGVAVTYTASAMDDVDGNVPVSCTPASGEMFQIGTTTVTCTAKDAAGNEAGASFSVHVKGADQQLADLADAVAELGPGGSLGDKVRDVQGAVGKGDHAKACEGLAAFTNQVKAQSGKTLTADQASALVTAAERIRAVLGC